jgi:hypothetical protein
MGGRGWASTVAGEVRYQDKHPLGDEYESADAATERQANHNAKRASPENVARTAATVLDTTSDELMDATYRRGGGNTGSEYVAHLALDVANRDREADQHTKRVADPMKAFAGIEVDHESDRETPDVSQPYPDEVPSEPNADDNAPQRAWAGSPTPDDPVAEDRRPRWMRERDRRQVREATGRAADTPYQALPGSGRSHPCPGSDEVRSPGETPIGT